MTRVTRCPDPPAPIVVPDRVGPVSFQRVGGIVAIRVPQDDFEIERVLRRARAKWDRGTRQWWIGVRRINRVVADLRRVIARTRLAVWPPHHS